MTERSSFIEITPQNEPQGNSASGPDGVHFVEAPVEKTNERRHQQAYPERHHDEHRQVFPHSERPVRRTHGTQRQHRFDRLHFNSGNFELVTNAHFKLGHIRYP